MLDALSISLFKIIRINKYIHVEISVIGSFYNLNSEFKIKIIWT